MNKEEKESIKFLISRCNECKFATCENCEINWEQVQAIDKLQKENQDYKKLILGIKGKLNNIQFEVEQAWRKIEKLENKYE